MSQTQRYLVLGLVVVSSSIAVGVLQKTGDWAPGVLALATLILILLGAAVAARLDLLERPPDRRPR